MLEKEFKYFLRYAHLAAPAIDQKPFRKEILGWLSTLSEKEKLVLKNKQTRIGVKLAIDMYEKFKSGRK